MKRQLFLVFLIVLAIYSINIQAQSELWGITSMGGESGLSGLIFKTDNNGLNQSIVHYFIENPGMNPYSGRLCKASNGMYYGMTINGGLYGKGIIFEYNPLTMEYTKKVDFDGTTKGSNPHGFLIAASNGNLYGFTHSGGVSNNGVLFEYNPTTSLFVKKVDFDGNNLGKNPMGAVYQASNGKLYGMTSSGGTYDYGTLFEYNISSSNFIKKIDFDGLTKGKYPAGSLIEAENGVLIGLTNSGGTSDLGIIFEYNYSTNQFSKKSEFNDANGAAPYGHLILANNGKYYGLTLGGGANSKGVIFEFDYNTSTINLKESFNGTEKGEFPYGSLTLASNGKLYGMTYSGGVSEKGVLFEYDPNTSVYIKKIDFDGVPNGGNPRGTLVLDSSGNMFGMTYSGGKIDKGVIFKYNPVTNNYTKTVDIYLGLNGYFPAGSLVQATNGKVYGVTRLGGEFNLGAIYEVDPISNSLVKLHDFNGDNGQNPSGSLTQATNGKLYGVTEDGGTYGNGVLYEFDFTANVFTKKIDFIDTSTGYNPVASLISATNGKLYGVTTGGLGSIYEYDFENEVITKIHNFTDSYPSQGKNPCGKLLQASNGKFYGITNLGGSYNKGVLYEFDLNSLTYTKKLSFGTTNSIGSVVYWNSLIEATNGKIYGLARQEGLYNKGVLFEYNPVTNEKINKIDFEGQSNGSYPTGSLMQATNGKIYGMTTEGGTNNYGVMFEYDPITSLLVKRIDFSGGENGRNSYGYLNLIEICNTVSYPSVIPSYCQNFDFVDITHTTTGATGIESPIGLPIGVSANWANNEITISGTPSVSGEFNYEIPLISSCGNISAMGKIMVNNCTNIHENNISNLIIYPNPAYENITLKSNNNFEKYNYDVIDLYGKIIFKGSFVGSTNIFTGNYSKGIYIIKVESKNFTKFLKFSKQ